MRIILSPAKKMQHDENGPAYRDLPVFLSDAEKIKAILKEKWANLGKPAHFHRAASFLQGKE